MVAAVKYENFIEVLINEEVDAFGTTDTFRAVLHTDAPVAATDDQLADLTQVTGTGYTAGGEDIQNDATRTGGTVTMTAVDFTWTAGAADWTQTGRYVSIHDDTSTSKELMQSYDYGAVIPIGNGETLTVDFGASLATFA
jgi:hypothetical protein